MTSKRTNAIEPSITMQVSALAQEMKKQGKPVIGYGTGEPDFDTPENIKQAGINAISQGKNKYTAASGISELKSAIIEKFKKDQSLDYTQAEIVISCGAKHSVYNTILALVDPSDEVIIPAPYWVSYPQQVSLAEGKSVIIDTTEETAFKITPAQLQKALTPKTKLLILNSPSNPTGMLYTKDELEAIAEIIVKNNIYVLSDEIYEKLIYDDAKHYSIAQTSDEAKKLTIIINGVSKTYAMTGWRIGYTASTPDIAKAMSKMQSHVTSNPTTPAQWASVEALTGPQDKVEEMRIEFARRRKIMVDLLNDIEGINCLAPQGAFYTFPTISKLFGRKSISGTINNSVELCEYLLKDKMVACVPGAGFGTDTSIRLSYATSIQAIEEGIARIKEWVESLT